MSETSGVSHTTTLNSDITKFLFSYGRKKDIQPGQVFITEGDVSPTVYVVLEGEAEILKKDDAGQDNVVARVGSGAILGEMGVFMQEKRTSSVRAATSLIALEFNAESFYTAIEKIPELAIRIIKSLSQKLKSSNDFTIHMRKAHNLLVISNNILAQQDKSEQKQFHFKLDLIALSRTVAVGRNALKTEIERLESAGVFKKLAISTSGQVEGYADTDMLLQYANEHTYPR
ncbi:MAG: cyclic nucleotide-binding domain-containing protein [Gammaproteobacteria bacterium]|nr:cyclic nucleotide-binding domain-containing protein [Gammaproteobacteria bacterium]